MEGSTKAQKIQAMKKHKRAQFLYNFVLYSLTSLITCLFFSYPLWFPSMKQLLFSLPNNISFFLNPRSFFLLGNLIVLILIRESKLARSSHSSLASDIYDEYVARSRSYSYKVESYVIAKEKEQDGFMQNMHIGEKKHGNGKNVYDDEEKKKEVMRVRKSNSSMHHHKEKKSELRECKSEVWDESEIVERKTNEVEKEGQLYMPREELNKRVEAFIARVNKQRLLEAKLVDYSRA